MVAFSTEYLLTERLEPGQNRAGCFSGRSSPIPSLSTSFSRNVAGQNIWYHYDSLQNTSLAQEKNRIPVKVVFDSSVTSSGMSDANDAVTSANGILSANGFSNTEFGVLESRTEAALSPGNGSSYQRADLRLVSAGFSESDKITVIVTNYDIAGSNVRGMWVEGSNVIVVQQSALIGETFVHEVGHVIDYLGPNRNGHSPDPNNIMYYSSSGRTGTVLDTEYISKFKNFYSYGSKW